MRLGIIPFVSGPLIESLISEPTESRWVDCLRDKDYLLAAAKALIATNDQRGLWELDCWCLEAKEGRIEAAQRALAGGDETVISWLLAAQACVMRHTVRPAASLQ